MSVESGHKNGGSDTDANEDPQEDVTKHEYDRDAEWHRQFVWLSTRALLALALVMMGLLLDEPIKRAITADALRNTEEVGRDERIRAMQEIHAARAGAHQASVHSLQAIAEALASESDPPPRLAPQLLFLAETSESGLQTVLAERTAMWSALFEQGILDLWNRSRKAIATVRESDTVPLFDQRLADRLRVYQALIVEAHGRVEESFHGAVADAEVASR